MFDIVGKRIRMLRELKGWTRADLANKAGLSLRFLADVEKGDANVSLMRLSEVAEALEVSLLTLLAGSGPVRDPLEELATLPPERIQMALRLARAPEKLALVGLRGAGKSSLGALLAAKMNLPFKEVDLAVEERAGMRLGEIFELHGEQHYRELERQTLEYLLNRSGGMVLATGGSVVTASSTWNLLRQSTRTIWLKASPATHLARVQAQGDFRPMRGRADALAELKQILKQREPLYAQSEIVMDTETSSLEALSDALIRALQQTTESSLPLRAGSLHKTLSGESALPPPELPPVSSIDPRRPPVSQSHPPGLMAK